MPRRLASDADLPVGPDNAPRLGIAHVLLADMDAVAIELERQIGPVVHDEGDAALLADRPQRVGNAGDRAVVNAFEAQLEGRDIAAVQRGAQIGGEDRRMLDALRRDEIEAAGGRRGGDAGHTLGGSIVGTNADILP